MITGIELFAGAPSLAEAVMRSVVEAL